MDLKFSQLENFTAGQKRVLLIHHWTDDKDNILCPRCQSKEVEQVQVRPIQVFQLKCSRCGLYDGGYYVVETSAWFQGMDVFEKSLSLLDESIAENRELARVRPLNSHYNYAVKIVKGIKKKFIETFPEFGKE